MRPNDWRAAKMLPKKIKKALDKQPEVNKQRPHKTKVSIVEEEEDVQRHQKGKRLTPLHPVLLDQDDDITINDIERIVEKASTFQNSSKSFNQIKEELQEVDDVEGEVDRAIVPPLPGLLSNGSPRLSIFGKMPLINIPPL